MTPTRPPAFPRWSLYLCAALIVVALLVVAPLTP